MPRNRHDGSALAVGMILLLVLTMLGIAGLGMARNALYMTSTEQQMSRAFRAAEAAIESQIAADTLTTGPSTITGTPVTLDNASATPVQTFMAQTEIASGGDSEGKFSAFHFEISATGKAARNARVDLVQGIYKKGKK